MSKLYFIFYNNFLPTQRPVHLTQTPPQMIIIPHEQLAEQIPTSNRIFSRNGTKEDFHPLLERTKYKLDQASFPKTLRARIPDLSFLKPQQAKELYL